jgi:Family of unknown function (DUF5723)
MSQRWRRLLLLLLIVSGSTNSLWAQGSSAIATSTYGGIVASYINPSGLADAPYRCEISLGGADWYLYNNLIDFKGQYSFFQYVSGSMPSRFRGSGPGGVFSEPNLDTRFNGQSKYANLAAEVRLPALTLTSKAGRTFAFSSRVRGYVQLNGLDEGIAKLARYGVAEIDTAQLLQTILNAKPFTLNVNAWQEIAASYALPLTPNQRHYFKVGGSVKYLVGLGMEFLDVHSMGQPVIDYEKKAITYGGRELSYGYTDFDYYKEPGRHLADLYNENRLGRGLGFDLGVTYEFRPNYQDFDRVRDGDWQWKPPVVKYRWRLAAALVDIGRIRYQKSFAIRGVKVKSEGLPNLANLDTVGWHGFQYLDELAGQVFGVAEADYIFYSRLPTTLNISADRRLGSFYSCSLVWQQNLRNRLRPGVRTFSSLTLIPRFEHRFAEIGLPIRWANDYRTLRTGLLVRIATAFVGTDDLMGVMGKRELLGYSLYGGATIPIIQRHASTSPRRR